MLSGMFTKQDIALIIKQCTIQMDTSPESIAGFAGAYALAKADAKGGTAFDSGNLAENILEYAEMIYPEKNANGYRNVWVSVGGRTCPSPMVVPRLMEVFVEAVAEGRLREPVEVYREFEHIHPFIDGNGRVGHLLWAQATVMETGEWPMELPPNIFGDPRLPEYRPPRRSSWGEPEGD